jgi:glutamyl-tRNA synthetase
MSNPVRVRIAPSPTGEPHVGTAYTALFNILLAKRLGGEFILRIEDTDQARSTPESERAVLDALSWLGLDWSEGPDKGGPYGPYRQSERRDIYARYLDQLLGDGHAFHCFCTPERLTEMRDAQRKAGMQPKYDGRCLHIAPADAQARVAAGETHVVRMKIPTSGECRFTDGVYGEIEIPWSTVDMQVIMKADGMPTYHLANVVDDLLMKITHVARGEEWLPSVPKHLLLYSYLGATPPVFMHLPLLRNPDRTKLSKRRNPTSLSWFRAKGYLPEALNNFLALAFVSIAEGDELMDFDQMAAAFDPEAMSKSGAVFNMEKLEWLNGRWIREKLEPADFNARVVEWAAANGRFEAGLALAQTRITTLSDLPQLAGFLLKGELGLTRADFDGIKTGAEQSATILEAVLPIVDTLPAWNAEAIAEAVRGAAEGLGLKLRAAVPPLFLAISGSTRSLPLFESMELLGRSMVRQRLKTGLAAAKQA